MSSEYPFEVTALFAASTDDRNTTHGVFIGGLTPKPWQRELTREEHTAALDAIRSLHGVKCGCHLEAGDSACEMHDPEGGQW
jgi:hypothetical protein